MMPRHPFDLDAARGYEDWRARKLEQAPMSAAELLVEIGNPRQLTPAERQAILQRIRRANMAIYASHDTSDDPEIPRALGRQFGLEQLDANWLADEDGISSISVHDTGTAAPYIPYTNRPIKWHTDGYYNPPERLVHGMLLHCVRRANQGGENRLMDHELAYLLLRDQNPDFISALMEKDVMVIPERVDETDGVRPPQAGPVFTVDPRHGSLHMRYTARTRSIEWRSDPLTRAAVAALEALLNTPSSHQFRVCLEPGMGLLCNNVLHDRSGFTDHPDRPRLLYRARYLDRITG